MPSSHLILCHPLLLLPPIPPSIRVFSNESTLRMRWPKYWSFSFSIIPSKEISGMISFRMDWLALLAVQGTPKSLLQHHSSKASILRCSAFFTVQLSHPYMTTGKTIAKSRGIIFLMARESEKIISFKECKMSSWAVQKRQSHHWISFVQCSFSCHFVNSWLSTVLYHKIDPGSMSETENSVAWTNVCFSEI